MKKKPNQLLRIWNALYKDLVLRRYKESSFWIMTAFIVTFVIARLIVRYWPDFFVQVGNTHVHHFTWGIVLLAISGYLATTRHTRSPKWLASLYGIGLALAVDEAGIWFHLKDYYYTRSSYDALVVVTALLINLVYFSRFWLAVLRHTFRWFRGI